MKNTLDEILPLNNSDGWFVIKKDGDDLILASRFPIIENILEELDFLKNCEFSRVTGSGSACFALFLNKKDGRAGLKRIKKRFPAFWCVLSKTI